jgi:hypothetical protein
MPKANVTRNDFVKFIANSVAMPSYGGTLYAHFHTADPGLTGTSSTNEVSYTGYARVAVDRSGSGFTICDPNGTPNANGTSFKNAAEITFPECTGVSDDVIITHLSLCNNSGQILYSAALTASIRVTNLITPRVVAGSAIFKEG